MATRAKFVCKSKSHTTLHTSESCPGVDAFTVELEAVNRCSTPQPDPEDEESVFGYFTPSGSVTMTILGEAARVFEPGKKVYADFHPAE